MRRFILLTVLFSCLVFSACTLAPFSGSPPVPTRIALAPGMGGFAGRVPDAAQTWADESQLFIYAAPFYGKDGEGFYTLEPSIHPSANMDSGGYFQIGKVPPGSYVLVVGPSAEEGRLVVDGAGKLKVMEARAGELNDLGDLALSP
jgi:hypothetical protein